MYPKILIHREKLAENVRIITNECNKNGINSIFGVVKVLAGSLDGINIVASNGVTHLADSRIENLALMKAIPLPKVLLRLPMLSEIPEVVRYADISLNSEIETISKLNEEAMTRKKIHQIILMFDLGDLREGIFFKDNYRHIIKEILMMQAINLLGIGTNLTCYGGVIPEEHNLRHLTEIKEDIESAFNIKLDLISGGNSSSLHLLTLQKLPKGINNLRIGEAIFIGRETAYGENILHLHQDIFMLEAEIIELQKKPSVPIGHIGVDAFGNKPEFTDKGERMRAICALGRQDALYKNLFPADEKIQIIGESSDHLILDVTEGNYHIGDIVQFKVNYGGLLELMTSPYIKKEYI